MRETIPDTTEIPQPLTVRAIQAQIGATLSGRADAVITGVNALETARPGEIAFAETNKHLPQVRASRASAIIVSQTFPAIGGRTLLRVDHPRLAFIKIMYLFQRPPRLTTGVHRDAVVAPDVELGEDVTIRECAVVRSHASIGSGTVIESGVHIGERVSVGHQCFIGPNVVIMADSRIGNRVIIHGGAVIGADGFGFVWADGRHLKIPQLGNVIIEDDVELGANVCVDRATFGSTLIKRGTKMDNLVQIAHNDVVGEHVILAGQAGLAGSVRIGNRSMLGGQSGVADHITIGDDVRVGGAAAVFKDIPAGESVWGTPARPLARAKREMATLASLPRLIKQLNKRLSRPASARASRSVSPILRSRTPERASTRPSSPPARPHTKNFGVGARHKTRDKGASRR